MSTTISRIFLIPHFHYDVAYSQTKEGYLPKCFDNLLEMLNIMKKNPEYHYLVEQVLLLDEFIQHCPEHETTLRKYIQTGRIEVGPGMYCMPDMNIPSGESLIRQCFYGRHWLKRHFGIEPRNAWIADSFGHHTQLPQIMKLCGYDTYCFTRGMVCEIETTEFFWEGIDGTRILTHWMKKAYSAVPFRTEDAGQNALQIKQAFDLLRASSQQGMMMLGNGADFIKPIQNAAAAVEKFNVSQTEAKAHFSTPRKFFRKFNRRTSDLQVTRQEMNPLMQGTYSSRIRLKQLNRFMEYKIQALEMLAAYCALAGSAYPEADFDRIWEKILVNQFHDIICGTLVDPAFDETLRDYELAGHMLDNICRKKIGFLASRQKPAENIGSTLMVFNPSPYSRCDTIAFDLGIEDDHVTDLAVYDSAGNAIPHQFVSTENYSHSPASLKYVSAIFQATVPPASPAVFRVEQVKRKLHYPSSLKISRTSLENEYLRLKLNERGMIYSLIDKTTGNEYIDRKRPYFNSLVYQHDFGDLWLYYRGPLTDGYFYRTPYPDPLPEPKNQPGSLVFECGLYSHDNIQNIEVIEQGPVRIGLRLEGVLNASRHGCGFTQYIYLSKNSKRIDFRTEIMPSGKHYRIRAVFPTPIENGLIRHEIPFGNVIREAGEYPAQNWMDYADRAKGLCLLNKGLPGNNVSDGCLMLSLMRSTSFETRGEETGKSEKAYEIGIPHRFEYAVIPYSNSDQSYHPAVCGQEFNMPFISRIIEPTGEDATLFPCGIKISPKNILLTAYYKTGNKIIARLYESEGRCSTVKISLPPGCIQAFEADVSGENLKPLEVENLEIVVVIQPFKIKTFVFKK